tara:strand:+ start:657 stop:824 length:168 start_codon:yes stop_codon:yes gene_type:complete
MATQEALDDLAYAKQEIERLKRGLSMVQVLSPERIWPTVLAELAVVTPTTEQEEQ